MVSIIIPHFNRSLLVKETIDSVKNQSYTDWEIIIVDDGSDENEWERVKTYEDEKLKIFKRTDSVKGPSKCRNVGVSKSHGKYLIFLDSDDLLADFCLEQRVAEIENDAKTDIAVFLIENFEKVVGHTKNFFNINAKFDKLTGLFLQNKNPWQTMAPIWKKEFFIKIGGFDENLLFMEDPDLHIRAINFIGSQIKICYDKPADCYYRINHMDKTKDSFWFNSIFYRIQFYKKLTKKNYSKDFIHLHVNDIKIGIYQLVKTFLYPRKNQFPELYIDLLNWMKESKLFTSFEIYRIKYLIDFGNSTSWIMRKLKMRGICYRLLPNN